MTRYLVVSFLTPPGLFVLLCLLAALPFLVRGRKGPGFLLLLLGLLLYGVSIGPVADALLRPLESPWYGLPDPRGDAIVLLGGGVRDLAPDLTGRGAPAGETSERLLAAARLARKLPVPVIVSGGSAFAGILPEAPVVRRLLIDLGIPPGRVVAEAGSRDTAQNARNTADLCRSRGIARPVLVTSAFHMGRSLARFGKEGIHAVPAPTSFRTWPGKRYVAADWFPSAGSLRDASLAVREYLAVAAFRAFGI